MTHNYPLNQLFWECTLRCNLSCRHCGSECKVDSLTEEMPFDHIIPVLDSIRRRQPTTKCIVNTVGGEPLVRADIADCGRQIVKRGFYWGMVSNAMLIDGPMMRELSCNGLSALAIDIDGLGAQHNWLRCNPDSFNRAYNAIGHIRKAPHLVWDVITCVNRINYPYLEEIKRMLIDAGVKKWRCFTIAPMGRAESNADLQIDDEQFRGLMEFICKTRQEGEINLSYSCEGFLGEYENRVRDHRFICVSGLNVASIRSNGDISGCLSVRSDLSQGNIYRDDFWDVWINRFVPFRNRSWMRTADCVDCKVYAACRGNGMHLRRSDGSLMTCHYQRLQRTSPNIFQ